MSTPKHGSTSRRIDDVLRQMCIDLSLGLDNALSVALKLGTAVERKQASNKIWRRGLRSLRSFGKMKVRPATVSNGTRLSYVCQKSLGESIRVRNTCSKPFKRKKLEVRCS